MGQAVRKITADPAPFRYKPDNIADIAALYQQFTESQGDAPAWLKEIGYSALTTLEDQGLPTPKLERWKYTNLPSAVKGIVGNDLGDMPLEIVPVDNYVQKLCDVLVDAPQWLVDVLGADPAGYDKYGDMALWALSNAFIRDGVVIDVPAGKIVDKPVELTFTGAAGQFNVPRIIVRLGAGAELTLKETHCGQGKFWNNGLTQIIVGKNAKLRHYRLMKDDMETVQTQNIHAQIERDGNYETLTMTTGAGVSRNQMHIDLMGENANCDLYGINLLDVSQHGDTTITVEHRAPHCTSNQFYRNVLNGQAKGVFQGKVHVHQIAQKTDGYQLSNTLLLSQAAEMDTKPELEIYADDVKCSHGATTGQLDEAPLFYLRSRGLSEQDARALMIESFTNEVIEALSDEEIRDIVRDQCGEWRQNVLR